MCAVKEAREMEVAVAQCQYCGAACTHHSRGTPVCDSTWCHALHHLEADVKCEYELYRLNLEAERSDLINKSIAEELRYLVENDYIDAGQESMLLADAYRLRAISRQQQLKGIEHKCSAAVYKTVEQGVNAIINYYLLRSTEVLAGRQFIFVSNNAAYWKAGKGRKP